MSVVASPSSISTSSPPPHPRPHLPSTIFPVSETLATLAELQPMCEWTPGFETHRALCLQALCSFSVGGHIFLAFVEAFHSCDFLLRRFTFARFTTPLRTSRLCPSMHAQADAPVVNDTFFALPSTQKRGKKKPKNRHNTDRLTHKHTHAHTRIHTHLYYQVTHTPSP